jgi:hypothetical protein
LNKEEERLRGRIKNEEGDKHGEMEGKRERGMEERRMEGDGWKKGERGERRREERKGKKEDNKKIGGGRK